MTTIEAIKTYFNKDTARPIENKELMELKKALKQDEWEQFGKDCAAALGAEWAPR